ncbi:Histidine kinase-, DNA gyrase B-, and HSP90-like ATPase [Halobacillus karajensis]|uniref:histidine kinase n=1 Tax=Halobacillus karajensis TaxID=195088 RepID=A0A024P978_9BACI|nr:sensor histidine kinase [Halobacillus karajensis]CDQ21261.1 Sensor histidine kinase YpdA [Halobacillus karajensis]CDQ25669.1 Sensor histidine kinase YpdA [Halobacillus karajensis]CDQ25940.1 Sensor histidine kinase YpdA [Halobacillus karajensis]SEI10159.1 Histidine kinase-, DNA gyrase B-, and HSP90-like ATPase [Halobacillus karajensis]
MIKIRTKLLIYFAVVLVLIVVLFFVRGQNDHKVTKLHNESMHHFFLLNEITQVTNETVQSLQIYVEEPLSSNLSFYEDDKQKLLELQEQFAAGKEETIDRENFMHMITSFLEHADQTVDGVNNEDVQQYSMHVNEAEKTSVYIHEETLNLINTELTDYQDLFSLTNEKIQDTKNMGTAIFFCIILLSVLFAIWFSNGITKTIASLARAAQEISAGHYAGEDVIVSRKDELWFLSETFNQMRKNVLESVNEIEEKARLARLLKEMELKSLQNQISPHFLFNTLNTISKTSYIEGAERTSDLISSVSALLRYNIGNIERKTTLKDEVGIVEEYFFIQKTRFGGRIEFEQNIDPSCLMIEIPCLTIQPIVENAFIHGVEEMAKGARIELNVYEEDEDVCIEVTDNGTGMDQQTVDMLLNAGDENEPSFSGKGSGHSTGIGMKNVIIRLRLFEKESEFNIHSALGKGTTIKIRLPRQEKPAEEEDKGW